MSLKNKTFMRGWISTAARVFRRDKSMFGENLPGRFEDWMHRECGIKKQTMRFFLTILRIVKNTYHGNITFVAIAKLVAHTLQHNLLL